MYKETRIGTWNVLTLYKGGALRNLEKEIRWVGAGILERRGSNIYNSCQKSKHEFGCGFIVSKEVKHLVIDFIAVDHRICTLNVKVRCNNLSLICAHLTQNRVYDKEMLCLVCCLTLPWRKQ
jgi:hypothetical protein